MRGLHVAAFGDEVEALEHGPVLKLHIEDTPAGLVTFERGETQAHGIGVGWLAGADERQFNVDESARAGGVDPAEIGLPGLVGFGVEVVEFPAFGKRVLQIERQIDAGA